MTVIPLRSGAAEARCDQGRVCPHERPDGGAAQHLALATAQARAEIRSDRFRLRGRGAGSLSCASAAAAKALRGWRIRGTRTEPRPCDLPRRAVTPAGRWTGAV